MTIVWLIIALLTAMAVWPVAAELVRWWWRSEQLKITRLVNDALGDE